jgi:hypothetical protein
LVIVGYWIWRQFDLPVGQDWLTLAADLRGDG